MTTLNFDIFGRDNGTGRTLDDLSRKVNNLADQVDRLGRAQANPNIRIDITEAERELDRLKTDLARMQGARLQINADTAKARADLNTVQRQLDELKRQPASVEVDAEIAEAEAKIEELKAKLAELKTQRLNFDADTAAATAKIDEMKAKLDTLRDAHINVDLDTTAATAQLTAFGAASRLFTNNSNSITNALRAVSAAVGPLVSGLGTAVSGIGSFVSAIGGGVGVISGLGSAISGIGSSVTSGGQALSQFGTAASGAFGSLASAAGSIGLAVAQLSALAGVGALAVGALGQIGGAAIALGSGIVPLVQSLGLLPGLIAPIGVALGTLAIGFSDAGTKGVTFQNTLNQLKTAFQPVIDSIRSQMQPAIQNLLQSFTGLAPVIQSVVPQITSAVSEVTNSFAQLFQSSSFKSDLQQFLSSAAQNVRVFGDAAKNAFQGFINVVMAAQPAVDKFAQFLDQGVQKWNAWTAAARQSGELTQIFNQAEQALEQIMSTIGNLAGLFVDLWNSANQTGAFQSTLQAINQGITQFRDYVTQAGGAWQQLMSQAGSITQSLVGLVGSIGNAFVTLGGQINISSSIDAISTAINNMTPAFAQIGQAATPVFNSIVEVAGRAAQALGPAFSQSITAIGTALKSIDWESTVSGIALVIQGFTNLVNGATQAANVLNTLVSFLQGEGASWSDVTKAVQDFTAAISDTSGWDAAKQSVQGLNDAIKGVPTDHNTQFNADTSGVQSGAQQAQQWIVGVSGDWDTKFTGDASGTQGAAQQATGAIQGVPQTHNTTLTAEGSQLIAAATQGTQAIQGVVPQWLTKFAGDSANLVQTAQQADQQVQSIPVEHKVNITADASSVQTATSQATSSLGGLTDKAVNITATDNVSATVTTITNSLNAIADKTVTISVTDQATTSVQSITDLINAMPDHTSTISINDQASAVLQQIANEINSLQDRTITITTNYVTTGTPPGQAAGSILTMGFGGGLSPMSGSSAQIVPPNSWRIIGDRMRGDEAYIPINSSARSTAILGTTANRMGYALVPMMGSGGFGGQDGQAWDWLAKLLRRWRGHRGSSPAPEPTQLMQTFMAHNTEAFGVGSSVGLSGSALPVDPQVLQTFYHPASTVPVPSTTGSGGHGGPKQVYVNSTSGLVQELLRVVRAEIRKQGGNVQAVLGV